MSALTTKAKRVFKASWASNLKFWILSDCSVLLFSPSFLACFLLTMSYIYCFEIFGVISIKTSFSSASFYTIPINLEFLTCMRTIPQSSLILLSFCYRVILVKLTLFFIAFINEFVHFLLEIVVLILGFMESCALSLENFKLSSCSASAFSVLVLITSFRF